VRKIHGLVVVIWLTVLFVGGALILTANFSASLSEFMPQSPTAQQAVLNEQLLHGILSRQIMIEINGGDASTRAKISIEIVKKLQRNAAFFSVSNNSSNDDASFFHYFFSHRYLLSHSVNSQLFTVAGLHKAIENSINMLATPGGEMVQSLFPSDPTGATVQLIQSLGRVARPMTQDGVWSSRSGQSALILAQTRASGSDMAAQQIAVNSIRLAFAKTKNEAGLLATGTYLMMTGVGVISVDSRDTIVHAAEMMSIISMTLITILLLFVYRSVFVLVLGLVPVFSGVIVGITAVALGFSVVYDITMGFGTALIGEAVDYSIYFFVQSGQSEKNTEEWIRNYWPTIKLGVFTSVIGFSSLLFSNLPGLAQIGLYAITGLLTAATVTRLILPILKPRHLKVRDLSAIGEYLLRWKKILFILRPGIVLMLIVACVTLVSHHDNIWDYKPSALSPVPAAEQKLYARLRADLGVSGSGYLVVVSGPTINATLLTAEKAGIALQGLVENDVIASYESPVRYLPSITMQQERQAAIPPQTQLAKRLHEALTGLPVKASLFTPFIHEAEIQRTCAPLKLADLHGTSIGMVVNSMLVHHGKGWQAILPIKAPASGIVNTQRIRSSLARQHIKDAMLIDLSDSSDQLYKGYLSNVIKLSLAGVVLIVVLLLFLLRSPVRVFRIMLPLTAAVLSVSAGFVLCGYELNIMNLIGLMLIVAIGSNYAIFFDQADRHGQGGIASCTLASLVIANTATIMGFAPLAFSGVPVLQAIGATVAPGVFLALLFSASFSQRQAS